MDGPPLRHVTFRVQHDCPLARLSQQNPRARLRVWSGHAHEIIEVDCEPRDWSTLQDAATKLLAPQRTTPTPTGGLIFWQPTVPRDQSITRRIEKHNMIWLQPMQVKDGWEHYDAFAFGEGGEQAALDDLRTHHPTQVARRHNVQPGDVAASLFLSLHPALEAPTDKQAEALVTAYHAGYYQSPRAAHTRDVATQIGIGRSALEERLRAGENRVMAAILPAMERHRIPPTTATQPHT